jgi:hypothetical protein
MQQRKHQEQYEEFVYIVREVHTHDFYIVDCKAFAPELTRDESIYILCKIAQQAHLKLSFNRQMSLGIFEKG